MRDLGRRRALVVGLGGLGCPASLALAQAGVGALTLVDPDRVDVTNLHRQPWHRNSDVGRWKVDSAREKLLAAFPSLKVTALRARVDEGSAHPLLGDHDLVIDATDSVAAKLMLSDAAVACGVPMVYGGVVRMEGQAMLIRPGGPCLRCLFEAPPSSAQTLAEDEVPTCSAAGVLGSVAGLVGGLQVSLALWALSSASTPSSEEAAFAGVTRLLIVDGQAGRCRTVQVHQNPACEVHSQAGAGSPGGHSPSREPLDSRALDLTLEVCPMTYVRTKLVLEALRPGAVLKVLLRGDGPRKNVPRSVREEGHTVLALTEQGDGVSCLLIRKRSEA